MDQPSNYPGSLLVHVYAADTGITLLSLADALNWDRPARFEHPMGYLSQPMLLKSAAVLQAVFDREGGVDKDEWADVVFGGEALDARWLDALRRQADDPASGFFMEGDAAFMQIPAPLASETPAGPIDGLFEPIRDRLGASSKALRMPTRKMGAICDACAAVALYLNHHFSNAKSQFWGTSPVRGALATVARFDLDEQPAGLRRTLLANVVHRGSPRWEPPKPLSWIPDRAGFNGLDGDGRTPCEKRLTPPSSLTAPANLQLPLIRGLRLEPPGPEPGRCGCCGRRAERLYSHYRIVPEPALLQQFSETTRKALKGEKSKVLSKMLMPEARHPNLGYRKATDEGGASLPISLYRDAENVEKTVPTWVSLADLLADDEAKPDLFRQLAIALYDQDRDTETAIRQRLDVGLFGVTFIGSTNPNIRAIFNDCYGFSVSAWRTDLSPKVAAAIGVLKESVVLCIQAWMEAALVFDYDITRTRRPDGTEALEEKKPNKRLKASRTYLNHTGALHALAAELWEHAYAQAAAWIENPHSLAGEAGETVVEHAVDNLNAAADALWRRYRDQRIGAQADFESLFLASRADHTYFKTRKKQRKKQEITL